MSKEKSAPAPVYKGQHVNTTKTSSAPKPEVAGPKGTWLDTDAREEAKDNLSQIKY